jgi:hypothetical protein
MAKITKTNAFHVHLPPSLQFMNDRDLCLRMYMRPSIGELAVPSIDIATAITTINQHTGLEYIQEVLHPEKLSPVLFLCRRASGHIKMVKGS